MEKQGPFITIPLRDGSSAAVGSDGVRIGERRFALADVQDARQVAPDPVTIALRVANQRHVAELQPVESDDGTLLLEALFRLRPDLRPAGFEPPATLPQGFPPLPQPQSPPAASAPWGAHPSWPPHPGMYPPPPQPPVSAQTAPYAPQPSPPYAAQSAPGGRLTPYPRGIGDMIGGIFALFTAHWRSWLLLGLVALFIPQVVNGAVDALFHVLGGNDLWAGLSLTAQGAGSGSLGLGGASLPEGRELLLDTLSLLITTAIGALIGGWSVAVLGSAGRDALFGRAPRTGAALRSGLKRVLPAMGANIISQAIVLLILLPVIIVYGILLTQFGDVLRNPTALDSSSSSSAVFTLLGCLGLLFIVPCGVYAIYVFVRLVLSPYVAVTEGLGPVASVRRSWSLTQRQWGHVFWPLFVIGLLASIIAFPVSFVEYASYGVAVLFISPLISALTAPLVALAGIVVLYDLRLRREGFAALASEGADKEPEPTSA